MATLDILTIGLYFVAVILVAVWAARRTGDKSSDYFLAGRDAGWIAIGTSLFVSNIGSEHLVGLAGTGAASGLAVGHFEWLASLILLLLGWMFVPFYLRSGVYTMPEFLERRYSSASRWYFTTISIISYVLTKISVSLYAGGIIIQELTGIGIWWSASLIVIFTGIYTIAGGLRAVLYTDMMQAFVLIAGSTLLVVLGLNEVGGWSGLKASLPEDFFHMWKPASDSSFPWTGIVFGAPILGVWYWCTDQYIVQRVLAAKGQRTAEAGTVFAAYLKILPVFLFVLPGMIAAALYSDVGGAQSDQALPALVIRLLPDGLTGILIAAMLAALMSSLSSVFNSCSTLITWDVYKQLRPDASEKTLVNVGRLSTVVLVVLGLLWIPFMRLISSQLYIYLQSVQGYIAPPIAACFLFGLLFRRLNGKGAITALLTGFVLGASRLGLELVNGTDKSGLPSGTWLEWVAEINFLHFAALLFVVCSLVLLVVSLLTERPDPEAAEKLRLKGEAETPKPGTRERRIWTANIGLSVLLVLIMIGLWITFA